MNYDDVFLKSDLGRQEIKSQHLGILPREARTLLIMIDGKRNYQDYLETLDHSKLFTDFGGVTPIFELLLELEYIKVLKVDNTATQTSMDFQSQLKFQSSGTNIETEFDHNFNSKNLRKMTAGSKKSITNIFKSKLSDAHYETIKSDMASYIEKNAPPAEAWSYLLVLEKCEDISQLLIMAQEIQNNSSDNLSHGMSGFIKRIQR